MPALSQQQQKLMGLALAVKRGQIPASKVNKSIEQFENPVNSAPVVQKGGKKTRRKLFKNKGKSKRVRFAI